MVTPLFRSLALLFLPKDVVVQENQPQDIDYDKIMAEQAMKLTTRRGSEGLDKKRPLIHKDR